MAFNAKESEPNIIKDANIQSNISQEKPLIKLWGKIVKKNNIIQNHVIELNIDRLTDTKPLLKGIETLCNHFDISNPIWMNKNTDEIDRINKTRFKAQHFIEEIEFDYFEIELIHEKV